MPGIYRRNMFINLVLTILLYELSSGRSIGTNDNETIYDEEIEYLEIASSTKDLEWNSTYENIVPMNDTEIANQDPMFLTTNQNTIEPDYVSSIASITHTFDEYTEQDITSSSTEGLEYMDIERMNTGKAKLETSTDKVETTESQISDMSTMDYNFTYEFGSDDIETTIANSEPSIIIKEISETELPADEMGNTSASHSTTVGQSYEDDESTTEENLHIFPKMFGISFVTGAVILSIIALVFLIKQFCCKTVAKNYAYRKLS